MKINPRNLLILTCAITANVCFSSNDVFAVNLRATPNLSLSTAYDTNVFVASTDEKSDIVYRATPALNLAFDVYETPISLNVGFDATRYSKYNELNSNSTSKYATLFLSRPMQVSNYLFVHPTGHYVETKDSIRKNELTSSLDPSVPPSEMTITRRTGQRDYGGGLGISYLLGSKLSTGLKGNVLRREFSETGPGLVDSRVYFGEVVLDDRYTPTSTYGIFLSTMQSDFSDGTDTRIYSGGMSGRILLSEQLVMSVRAGASRADETVAQQELTEWSPYGFLSLLYTRQDFIASILGSYELSGEGSFGHTTKKGTVVLGFSDRFTPRWRWNLTGTYQNNRSIDPLETENIDTHAGTGSITHEITDWVSVFLSGSIERQKSHGPLTADIDRSVTFLGFRLSRTYTIF